MKKVIRNRKVNYGFFSYFLQIGNMKMGLGYTLFGIVANFSKTGFSEKTENIKGLIITSSGLIFNGVVLTLIC